MSSRDHTFSVVVPSWNRLELLQAAVESVRKQLVPPDEIVVVDDGSSDGSVEWLEQQEDLQILQSGGKGPGGARNCGVKRARGRHVCFLDCDDAWHPRLLEIVGDFLQQESFAMILVTQDEFSGQLPAFSDFAPEEVQPEKFEDLLSFLEDGRGFAGTAVWACVEKKIFDDGAYFAEGRGVNMEDLEWMLQNGAKGPVLWIRSPKLLAYRLHDNQATKTFNFYLEGLRLLLRREKTGFYPLEQRLRRQRIIAGRMSMVARGGRCFSDFREIARLMVSQWRILSFGAWVPCLPRQFFHLVRIFLRSLSNRS